MHLEGLVPAARLLAELALAEVLPRPVRNALRKGRNLVILVLVPSPAWVKPIDEAICCASLGKHRSLIRTARPRPSTLTDPDAEAAELLDAGRPIVVVTPETGWISPVLLAAADHTFNLSPLAPALVSRAIALWCGRRPRTPITAADLAGLDLLDVAAALRPDTAPAECIRRLARASRARVRVPEVSEGPPLSELTGYGEAHTWALQLVADIDRVRRGALSPRLLEGAVFYGVPGTGKTTLAKAIAQAAGVPFLTTNVGSWFTGSSGNLDGVAKAAENWFTALSVAAKASGGAQTAIGFCDEADALPNRARLSDRGADWWLPICNLVIQRVEELRREGIILLAATNDLSRLDLALLRPGRFDRQFEIRPPDEAGRLGILRGHLGSDLNGVDLTGAARLSAGATGAVLAGAVRGARRKASGIGRLLTLDDLLDEIAPADVRSPKMLLAVAWHEAGHAVLGHRLGLTIASVTIQAGPQHGGATHIVFDDPAPDRAALEARVIMLLAGRAADTVLGCGPTAGAASDLREATRLLAMVHAAFGLGATLRSVADPEHAAILLREDRGLMALVEADLQRLRKAAEASIAADRAAIEAVAEALLVKRVLTGAEVAVIATAHPPRVRRRAGSRASMAGPSNREL